MALSDIFAELKKKIEEDLKKSSKKETNSSSNEMDKEGENQKQLSIEEVLGSLDQIENKFSSGPEFTELPNELKLEKLELPAINEDEISAETETELQKKYATAKSKVEGETEKNKELSEIEKQKSTEKAVSDKVSANEMFDKAKSSTENEALKRGLARSSIILFELSNIEEGRANELLNIQKTLTTDLSSIEKQLAKLEREKDSSLESLDLEYASELSQTIKKKISELEEKKKEIVEYNNKVAEIEAEFNLDLLSTKSKLEADQVDFRSQKEKEWEAAKLDEKFKVVSGFLNSMPKKEALKVLVANSAFAEQLGGRFYEMYYAQMAR